MKYYYLDSYRDFSCLAGACPSTCCAGWKIVVDGEALERFDSLSDDTLREDIVGHIVQKDGQYYFQNRSDGRCSMLDEDGLCRIQRHTEERMLCVTCRKYPRLAGNVQGDCWLSMAASCPVVAAFLWKEHVGFFVVSDGKSHSVAASDIPLLQQRLAVIRERYGISPERLAQREASSFERAEKSKENMLQQIRCAWGRYQNGYRLVTGCLELLTQYGECGYLEGSFEYFEQSSQTAVDVFWDMTQFEQACGESLALFYSNYLVYRLYSVFVEDVDEREETVYRKVFGEMALFHMVHFSRYHTRARKDASLLTKEKQMQEAVREINWCYRFFAHGDARKEAFLDMLEENFPTVQELVEIFYPTNHKM